MNNNKNKHPDISVGIGALKKYIEDKAALVRRIESERAFWSERYSSSDGKASAWLFNSVISKHADVIDNMPVCVCLPREKNDTEAADMLTKIIPVINKRSRFDKVYSDNAWEKIRHGTAVYGVFWNNFANHGMGDIEIKAIDIESIFWESGVSDIQDSGHLFICTLEDIDTARAKYPVLDNDGFIKENQSLTQEIYGEKADSSEKCAIVDWYYKVYKDGRSVLHYCKLAGNTVIYSSEADESCPDGWYTHGKYPVVFDTMYPCDHDVCGFGIISIGKECQEYIDTLDKNLIDYTNWASRVRFWAKKSLGVNLADFADLSKGIIEVEGDIDEEKLKRIDIGSMDGSVIDIKKMKIEELKETTGCRDVMLGGTVSGVTAASAIGMLQNAGNKLSRDGIESSCRACVEIWDMTVELIRQFYDEERVFRIVGEDGEYSFESFSAADMGDDCPMFDIEIDTRKRAPDARDKLNDLVLKLYRLGAFDKENLEKTELMLSIMDFDGIGKLRSYISHSAEE